MLHMGKAIRNVIQFITIISVVLTIAYIVLTITGQNGYCFVALAITIVLDLWGYRARWIAELAFRVEDSTDYKKKDKGSNDDSIGPFAPESPLTSIPGNTYFVRMLHSDYQPGMPLSSFGDLGEGCAPDWLLIGIPTLAISFSFAWGALYGLFMVANDQTIDRVIFWLFLLLLAPLAIWSLLAFSGQWGIDWHDRRNKWRFEDDSVPLLGTILRCEREFEEVRDVVTHYIRLEYVFTTPMGRQIMKTIVFRDTEGTLPQAGRRVVVMYLDDKHYTIL